MANRRMVNIRLIDSDLFLDLPLSAQALYFHMLMRADDDGFINSPMRLLRTLGCNNDDYKLLIAKGLILTFDTGVIVIKHWRLHNYLRKDRYRESICKEEKEQLYLDGDNTYTFQNTGKKLLESNGIPIGNHSETNGCRRLGKDRLGKDRLDNNILPEESGQHGEKYNLLLKDGTEYTLTENDVQKLEQLYPEVDVRAEIRKMIGWLDASPERRKTRRGIKRFVNGWISRSYDAVQKSKSENKPKDGIIKSNSFHNFEQRDYDMEDLENKLLKKQLGDDFIESE